MNTGAAHGGPMDGIGVTIRRPRGFIVVDKAAGRVWIYDWTEGEDAPGHWPGHFRVREPEGRPLEDGLRWAAAEGDAWDVLAHPGGAS